MVALQTFVFASSRVLVRGADSWPEQFKRGVMLDLVAGPASARLLAACYSVWAAPAVPFKHLRVEEQL